ncbi:hypothetical protein EXIGLDRAFT_808701 [Exidia glandulosa HHB12029]|uniref:Uncharacterized protein n=1 Tax=Exidia glandulosa HHB12029 TaxID=1314781 RepID=A0A165LUD7_EXIGL|nr:hypothetical protein EXIGLDRAFT_808701 [Exidia glandulosa HHB12029]
MSRLTIRLPSRPKARTSVSAPSVLVAPAQQQQELPSKGTKRARSLDDDAGDAQAPAPKRTRTLLDAMVGIWEAELGVIGWKDLSEAAYVQVAPDRNWADKSPSRQADHLYKQTMHIRVLTSQLGECIVGLGPTVEPILELFYSERRIERLFTPKKCSSGPRRSGRKSIGKSSETRYDEIKKDRNVLCYTDSHAWCLRCGTCAPFAVNSKMNWKAHSRGCLARQRAVDDSADTSADEMSIPRRTCVDAAVQTAHLEDGYERSAEQRAALFADMDAYRATVVQTDFASEVAVSTTLRPVPRCAWPEHESEENGEEDWETRRQNVEPLIV